jgi:Spx/MgsR family transcriptional regulator
MTELPTLYGLPNCNTCKKARAWLTARGIAHEFIDYRAQPLAPALLQQAAQALGWDKLVNRASTTWRQLEESDKTVSTASEWLDLLTRHPTLIRRPLLIDGQHIDAGFKESRYAAHFETGADA